MDVLKEESFMSDLEAVLPQENNPTVPDEVNLEAAMPSCVHFLRRGTSEELLVAAVEPTPDDPGGYAISDIKDWICEQGCGNWQIYEDAVLQLAREIRRLKTRKEYILAERKDFHIEIQVPQDRLKAWIRVSPAFGGMALTEPSLRQALADRHVSFGINEEILQQILSEGSCERIQIAEGIAPVQGEPAKFEQLVQESEQKGVPQERANGTVDYKDLGLFVSVDVGTPLLKRIPPAEGIPGTGVDGNPVPAPVGADRALIPESGTAISKDDPDIIVATKVGKPSYLENSVRVDPNLEIDSVDPSTGNVIFEGNIVIRGPVESGFTVKAGQDLSILDTVEGADLIAGNNIFLLTGVYGKSKSNITAGGNIEARFLSDCTVRCGGNLEVLDLIAHCNVECEGSALIGKHGGKGQLFGGKLLALGGVQAQILGSNSEATTVVEVAAPRNLLLQKTKTDQAVNSAKADFESTEKELLAIEDFENEGSKASHLSSKLSVLSRKLAELKKEQTKIQEKLSKLIRARIKSGEVHRGVTLCIGEVKRLVSDLMTDISLHTLEEKPSNNLK